jgi:hypothetical protein
MRIPWTSQPPVGYGVNWENPITRNLIWLAHFGRGVPYEETLGEMGTFSANANGLIREDGILAGDFPDGQTNGGCDWPQHPDRHSGHSALTIMCYAKRDNNTPNSTESPMAYAGTGSDAWDCSMAADGTLRFRFDITDVAQEATLSQGSLWDYSEWNIFGGTWESADVQYARANKDKGSANNPADGTNTANNAAGNNPRLGQRQNGATDSWFGQVAWGAVWSRALTDAEWNYIVDHPWELFAPQRVYAPVELISTGPTITDVDTDETWDDGDTGLVITGTGFV